MKLPFHDDNLKLIRFESYFILQNLILNKFNSDKIIGFVLQIYLIIKN